jgi:uncharacterized membrane protein
MTCLLSRQRLATILTFATLPSFPARPLTGCHSMQALSQIDERDSRLRSFIKAVTYRITGTITTALIVFVVTGELAIAMAVGIVEPLAKIIIYYVHERLWELVPHGTIRRFFNRSRRV